MNVTKNLSYLMRQ